MCNKKDLEKANEELKKNVAVLEAKSRPENTWAVVFSEAFASGYGKGFDEAKISLPNLTKEQRESIRTDAIDEAVRSLEPTINQRLEAAGKGNLRPVSELLSKKLVFEEKLANAITPQEKEKYSHFIEALGWALDGNTIHKG